MTRVLVLFVAMMAGLAQQAPMPSGGSGRAVPSQVPLLSPAEPVRPDPIGEQLDRVPLSREQKDQVRSAIEARNYRQAEEILVGAINADPKSADLLILAARVFSLDKNPINAAIALKKAEKIRPLAPKDRFSLAMAYLGFNRGPWARPELEKLAADDPANPLYPYWLARIDFDEHMYDSAIARLEAITKAHPDFTRAWDNLGLSLEGAGRLSEAAASYREAIRLDRGQNLPSPWPLLNLGTLLNKMAEFKEAEALLREAVGYEPKLAEAHYRLGVNLQRQGRDQEAIAELKQACELDPNAAEPLYALGQLYRKQGDEKAAAETFERFRAVKKIKRGS